MLMNIMTYNIAGGRYYPEGRKNVKFSPEESLAVIKKYSPDFCALNEVDKGLPRSEKTDILGMFAKGTGMNGYFSPSIFFDGGEYGNAFLSRYEIIMAKKVFIPDTDDGLRHERRSVICAKVRTEAGDVRFIVSHFGLTDAERVNAVKTVASIIDEESVPTVFMGDLNTTPCDPVLDPLHKRLRDAGTLLAAGTTSYPSYVSAEEPPVLIDHIMVSEHFKVKNAFIPNEHVSDHLPYICEAELNA